MTLNEFVEELDVAIKQDGHDIYCNAETAKMLKSLINDGEKHKIYTIYATPPNDLTTKDTGKAFCNMKFKVPENCGSCLSIEQFGNKYICGMSASKEKGIIDISAFEVDINSRPHWCPKNEVINIINNLSEENKVLVDKMCDGFSAMFELMNNQKEKYNKGIN